MSDRFLGPFAAVPNMLVGLFADTHDHLANIRLAVERFDDAGCELVLFAGDLAETLNPDEFSRLGA